MSFHSNSSTRRTKRACVNGIRRTQLLGSTGFPAKEDFGITPGSLKSTRTSAARHTIIGHHESKGITILGGVASLDHHFPLNPDGRDIPMGTSGQDGGVRDGFPNSTVAKPPFPIVYNGPGFLKFENAVAIATLLGDTTIRGDLKVDGTLTTVPPTVTFAPVLEDDSGNEPTGVTTSANYRIYDGMDYFELEISWTGKGSITTGDLLLTGFPSTYSSKSEVQLVAEEGLFTARIGNTFTLRPTSSGLELMEINVTSGLKSDPVIGTQLHTAGTIRAAGWIKTV